jgi:hypothetical protein
MEFAVRVAEGEPLVAAYREVYKPANDKAPSVYQNAKRAAKHPGIATRIRELQIQLLPAPEDMKAVYAHGLATIIQLSNFCEDSRVRLRAAQWLCAEAERRKALEAEKRESSEAARTPNSQEVLSQLEALYRKALPAQELLVEEVSDETAENLPQLAEPLVEVAAEDAPPARSVAAFLEEIRQAPRVEAEVPKSTAPQMRYIEKLVSKPGHFPPQFVRVPVRKSEGAED